MTIVGFHFTKMNAERGDGTGKLNITNNLTIKGVEEAKLGLDKSKKGMKYAFEFVSKYEPKAGSIVLGGEVLVLEDAKVVDNLVSTWKKEKKLPKDMPPQVINLALAKCNVQALIF